MDSKVWIIATLAKFVAVGSLAMLAALFGAPPTARAQEALLGYVTHVVDGDKINVVIGNRIESVCYIGMKAPELHSPSGDEEPGGSAAREMNRRLVDRRWVTLVFDVALRDRFGRLLAYVWADGFFVNAELVSLGYAKAAPSPPNVRYAEYFRSHERRARRSALGLWSSIKVPPLDREYALPDSDTWW